MRTISLLLLSALLYLVPGGAAVAWLFRDRAPTDQSLALGAWVDRLILAAGISVAINTFLVYATMAGVRASRAIVLGFLVVCAGMIVWAAMRKGSLFRRARSFTGGAGGRSAKRGVAGLWSLLLREPVYLVLCIVVLLISGVRFWIMRDMAAPRWGDSYQHAVITQLLIDHGGLFASWEPYAPYTGLTTHFGFHANAALFHWISGIGATRSVLWVGQIMNVSVDRELLENV